MEDSPPKIEVGYGVAKDDDPGAAGRKAARQALASIIAHPISAVMVFASVRYDLHNLLSGIRSTVGNVPILGASTAGEICNGAHEKSVVVVALASPYLTVRIGIGRAVSVDWQRAARQAVSNSSLSPFFSSQDNTIWDEMTQRGESGFGIVFSPGNTRHADSRGHEILEELKKLSLGRLPLFGGCAADDWLMEANYIFLGSRAYPDSMLVAVFQTKLQFGIAMAHGLRPSARVATVTKVHDHKVLELNGRPADAVYAELLGASRDSLEGKHLTFTTGKPLGIRDTYGEYTITVASLFTPDGGLRLSRAVSQGAVLTVMEPSKDEMLSAGKDALLKAMLRSGVANPAVAFTCSCALRSKILGQPAAEEISRMKEMVPSVPVVGFYSFGEYGTTLDGVDRYNNGVITTLSLGPDLSYAARVAEENRRLRRELDTSVTQLKQTKESLRSAEEFLRTIVDNLPIAVFAKSGEDHGFILWNKASETLFGYSREQVIGKNDYDFFPKEQADFFWEKDRETWDSGAVTDIPEEPILTKNMGARVLHTRKVPLYGKHRRPHSLLAISEDITERKEAEEALRESEERYSRLFEDAPLMYVITRNEEGVPFISDCNELFLRSVGYKREEVVGHPLARFYSPKSRSELLEGGGYARALAGEFFIGERELLTRDGRLIPTLLYTATELDPARRVTGTRAMFVDITDLKKSERALRDSEERFRQVAASAGEWIWEVDANGVYRFCSSAVERILGYSPDELVGQKYFYDLFPPEVGENLKTEALGVFRRKENFSSFVNPNLHKDGSVIILETSGSAVQDEDGNLLGYRGTHTDVTERKRAKEALERRIIALTRPLDEAEGIAFEDLFNLDEIQRLQDQVASAFGVASLITRPDGSPITKPSNFCRLCEEVIRRTETGLMNCQHSDATIGRYNPDGPTIQPCLSAGMCNAGTSISVGGRHIANWLIGQVRNEMQDDHAMRAYARTIGSDEEAFMEAFYEAPYMKQEQFVRVAQALHTLAGQLSTVAYQNVQQARFIAERRAAEDALRESEERLRLFIGHAPTSLAMFDREMRYLAVSRCWMNDYRFADQNVVGRSHYETSPWIPDHWKEVHRRALEGEVVRAEEDYVRYEDGTGQWQRWEVRPWYTAEGGIGGIVIFAEDITRRKQAEEARLSSERKYRALFDESRDGVYFVLRGGEITDVNPSFCEISGYSREELIGRDVRELWFDPAERQIFQKEIEKKGFVKDHEIRFRKKDGTEFDALLTSSVDYGDDGGIVGYRGIMRDLTIYKRLQNQLFQAQKMEAIGTLAGGIAHDFNNVLQIVLGHSDILIIQKGKRSPDLKNLEAIRKAAKDGGNLVKGLLTFSRQGQSNMRSVDLNQLLKNFKGILQRMIPRMIEIKIILADDLRELNADPMQIEQVLMNLGVNAHHAMSKGGTLTIEARNVTLDEDYCRTNVEAKPGEYVLLKISDTGHGMEKEVVERIFEPFFTTKEVGKGTGLGLSVVYGIVKNHRGHITCSSEPGQGATFSIYLPAVTGASEPDMATTSGAMPAFGTETILVVDDEEPVTNAVESILTHRGYKVLRAANGAQALEIYREKKEEIDLVVLDLNMPGMSGMECLDGILKIDPEAKVLVASGHSVNDSTMGELEVGSSGFIAKPFESRHLLRAVRRVLDGNS